MKPKNLSRAKSRGKKLNLLVAILILLIGIFIGGFLVLKSKTGKANIAQSLTELFGTNSQSSQTNEKNKDSDNDGLTDWQEEIYKTDPNNPDTDGDGYLDGEEVLSGYDPLKPGPDDKLSEKAISPRPSPGSLGVNLTQELAKNITENIQKTQPDASWVDQSIMEFQASQMLDNALSAALAKSPQFYLIPTIPDSEIKISQETSDQAIKDYISKIMEAWVTHLPASNFKNQNDLSAVLEAIQTKDFTEVDKYIKGYKDSYLAIKEISVPLTWKEIQKKNLSLLLGTINILEAAKLIDEDPLRATLALQQYKLVIDGTKEMLKEAMKLTPGAEEAVKMIEESEKTQSPEQ